MKIEDFEITKEQEKAFKSLVRAVNKCSKSGLRLFGKQHDIVAFPAKAYELDLVAPLHAYNEEDHNNPVPYIFETLLSDSGADDMEYFRKGVFNSGLALPKK